MRYRDFELSYTCERDALSPALREVFVELDADASTRAWIDDCIARPHGAMITAARSVARKVMSDFDANGMLGAHDMRVLGTDQARHLLGCDRIGGRLLDVGAGARASAAGARRAGAVGAVQKRSMGVIFTGHLGGGRPCPASRMAQRRDRFKWGKCACRRHFVGAVHRIGGVDGLGVRWLGRNNRRTFQASLPDSSYNMYYVKFQKGRWKFGSLRRSPVPVSGGPPSPGPGTVPIGPLPPPSAGPGHLGLRRPSSRSVPGDRV